MIPQGQTTVCLGERSTAGGVTCLILMAVHNGARFLPAQLESIARQSLTEWQLVASDDSSTDGSRDQLEAFAKAHGADRVRILTGPCLGAAQNFRHLLRQAPAEGRLVAFCDQDDIWHPDHLARAVEALHSAGDRLALYGCALQICDADLAQLGLSPHPRLSPSFRNALVQNIFSGNGMVLSPEAADFLSCAERELTLRRCEILLHDWWAYQMVTGAGGTALYDPRPGLSYRQHGGNLIGANRGIAALPRRLTRYLDGSHGRWYRLCLEALLPFALCFTEENRASLATFAEALDAPLWQRLTLLRQSGVHHQGRIARGAFWLSAGLGRL